jgi:hypothetical protein
MRGFIFALVWIIAQLGEGFQHTTDIVIVNKIHSIDNILNDISTRCFAGRLGWAIWRSGAEGDQVGQPAAGMKCYLGVLRVLSMALTSFSSWAIPL